jgi:hypothetical protein
MSVPPRLDLLQVSALVGARQYEKLRNKSVEPTRSFLGIIERGGGPALSLPTGRTGSR